MKISDLFENKKKVLVKVSSLRDFALVAKAAHKIEYRGDVYECEHYESEDGWSEAFWFCGDKFETILISYHKTFHIT